MKKTSFEKLNADKHFVLKFWDPTPTIDSFTKKERGNESLNHEREGSIIILK
jgi:hypothetical protein